MIELNSQQLVALSKIQDFLIDDSLDVFILRGSAGTGKTTLIAKLIEHLNEVKQTYALLAPTGRASRILSAKVKQITNTQIEGSTVHRMIYHLDKIVTNDNEVLSINDPALRFHYPLKEDESTVNLFIIDEASMIGDKENKGDVIQFGSGKLLKDILNFCRVARFNRSNDHTTKIIFVGDIAQLPPVGENFSPALSEKYLSDEYNIKSIAFDLTEVMRQVSDSSILMQATNIRNAITENIFNNFKIEVNNKDVYSFDYNQALIWIVDNIINIKSSVAVVYSNEKALGYNRSIREKLHGGADVSIKTGDFLLVNKNSTLHQLNNGDLVKVVSVNPRVEKHSILLKTKNEQGNIEEKLIDLMFRQISVAYRSINGNIQVCCFILENLLDSPNRELSPLEIRALYVDFLIRNPQAKDNKALKKELLKTDLYFNALQVKYGYAVTCHKAQGGEWENVLVDFSGIKGLQNKQFFQWAYTAITRSSQNLIVVNAPKFSSLSVMNWGDFIEQKPETKNEVIQDLYSVIIENKKDKPDNLVSENLEITVDLKQLQVFHLKLTQYWKEIGFIIINLEHLQYCERYTLSCDNKIIQVQYYYNGKFKISRYEILPNQDIDNDLSQKILSAFNNISNNNIPNVNKNNKFIEDFLQTLDKILSQSPIKRESYKVMPYRLRIAFSDEKRKGELDFNFNGKQNWTTVQEVGGIGATNGLFQEISMLIKNSGE